MKFKHLSARNKGIWRFRSRKARRPSFKRCPICNLRIKGQKNYFNHKRSHKDNRIERWGDLTHSTLEDPTQNEFESMLETWTRLSPLKDQVAFLFGQAGKSKGFQSRILHSQLVEAGVNLRKRHNNFSI